MEYSEPIKRAPCSWDAGWSTEAKGGRSQGMDPLMAGPRATSWSPLELVHDGAGNLTAARCMKHTLETRKDWTCFLDIVVKENLMPAQTIWVYKKVKDALYL